MLQVYRICGNSGHWIINMSLLYHFLKKNKVIISVDEWRGTAHYKEVHQWIWRTCKRPWFLLNRVAKHKEEYKIVAIRGEQSPDKQCWLSLLVLFIHKTWHSSKSSHGPFSLEKNQHVFSGFAQLQIMFVSSVKPTYVHTIAFFLVSLAQHFGRVSTLPSSQMWMPPRGNTYQDTVRN